jgi:hypothetical protein
MSSIFCSQGENKQPACYPFATICPRSHQTTEWGSFAAALGFAFEQRFLNRGANELNFVRFVCALVRPREDAQARTSACSLGEYLECGCPYARVRLFNGLV